MPASLCLERGDERRRRHHRRRNASSSSVIAPWMFCASSLPRFTHRGSTNARNPSSIASNASRAPIPRATSFNPGAPHAFAVVTANPHPPRSHTLRAHDIVAAHHAPPVAPPTQFRHVSARARAPASIRAPRVPPHAASTATATRVHRPPRMRSRTMHERPSRRPHMRSASRRDVPRAPWPCRGPCHES